MGLGLHCGGQKPSSFPPFVFNMKTTLFCQFCCSIMVYLCTQKINIRKITPPPECNFLLFLK